MQPSLGLYDIANRPRIRLSAMDAVSFTIVLEPTAHFRDITNRFDFPPPGRRPRTRRTTSETPKSRELVADEISLAPEYASLRTRISQARGILSPRENLLFNPLRPIAIAIRRIYRFYFALRTGKQALSLTFFSKFPPLAKEASDVTPTDFNEIWYVHTSTCIITAIAITAADS